MNETITAAFAGALAASMQQTHNGPFKMLRVMITGFFLAYFVGEDAVNFIQQFLNFKLSLSGTIFLLAFFGTELLEKMLFIARSAHVTYKWGE